MLMHAFPKHRSMKSNDIYVNPFAQLNKMQHNQFDLLGKQFHLLKNSFKAHSIVSIFTYIPLPSF